MKKVLFISLFVISSCQKGEGTPSTAPSDPISKVVTVIEAKEWKSKDYIDATGILFPSQDVTIMAGVPGEVIRIEADEGSIVKRGAVLAVLDQTEYKIAVAQAEAQFESARLGLKQLEIDYQRNKALHESGSITDSQMEQIALKLELAKNQLVMAKEGLAMARKKLNDTVIRAPFDCYVTNRLVSIGSRITAMPPTVLFRVIDLAHLDLKLQLPDIYVRHVQKGNRVVIRFESLDKDIEETIHEVISSVDPRSMTFTAIVKIDNTKYGLTLKPGIMGYCKVYGEGLLSTYLVEKKNFKFLDMSTGKGKMLFYESDKAWEREVAVEKVDDLRVRVIRGLQDDDKIVISGIEFLQSGDAVKPIR